MDIQEKLNYLHDTMGALVKLEELQETLIESVIPEEVKAKIEEIKAEFGDKKAALEATSSMLRDEIKNAVLLSGKTAKTDYLMAVYNKGRDTWDGKGLDGYAVAHPEIRAFKTTGSPTVVIREK